jgi:hypothetical protein
MAPSVTLMPISVISNSPQIIVCFSPLNALLRGLEQSMTDYPFAGIFWVRAVIRVAKT